MAAQAWIEWVATALGLLCVALGVVRSVWTFPTAIASVSLVAVVAFRSRLYSDFLLQLFFAAANVYGWVNWRRSRAQRGAVVIERLMARDRARWLATFLVVAPLWAWLMARTTDASYPWWDGSIAVASVIAQILMGRRLIENWPLWVAVDLASVPLYLVKGLTVFALLYLLYLAIAAWGWIDWRRTFRAAGPAVA